MEFRQDGNYLVVIERAGTDARGNARWRCRCTACQRGKVITVSSDDLLGNKTRSCGCRRGRPKKLRDGMGIGTTVNFEYRGRGVLGRYQGVITAIARDVTVRVMRMDSSAVGGFVEDFYHVAPADLLFVHEPWPLGEHAPWPDQASSVAP